MPAAPITASSPKSKPPGMRPARQPFVSTPSSPALVNTAGPDPDVPLEDVRLAIGSIGGTHGTDGELRMRLATDEPDHLRRIKRVYVGDEPGPRRLLDIRFHAGVALIRLSGVRTPEEAAALLGLPVRISGQDARPLKEGEFYYYQVIGVTAYDEAGETVGTVTDILETGANDVFVINPPDGGKEILIPNIPSAVLSIDSGARRMVIRPLVYWDSPKPET
jgi:16S rRNA processing protein RimM